MIQIGKGHVHHSRQEGAKNNFRYPTFFLHFDCAEAEALRVTLAGKFRRFLSFSTRDYLDGKSGELLSLAKNFIKQKCDYDAEQIYLHTMPRMLGFVFNPVSFWLCYQQGKMTAALVEVNNTFGERHFYWIRPGGEILADQWYRVEKVFHVSPFMPVEGYYQFRFKLTDQQKHIDINYHSPAGPLRLVTWVTGLVSPLRDESVFSVFSRYGWMTPLVVFRIHFQALRLWLKKSRFYRKPALPRQEVSS